MHAMNNSEMIEILKTLYTYKNEEANTNSLPDYPLDINFVKIVSQNITDIIYDSYSSESVNVRNTRATITGLLKQLIEPNSHLPIDESNCDIFIKCVNKKPPILDTFYQKYGKDFVTDCAETSDIKKQNEWKNICDTINKKYFVSLENKIKSGLIQTWNKIQFDKINFEYNNPNTTFQDQDIETSLGFLNNLKSNSNKVIVNEEKPDYINKSKTLISEDDTNSIQLVYALLHFDFNSDIENLFLKVLQDVSASKSGAKFVEYIWENKDNLTLPPSIFVSTLKKFKYLFEKPIISLGTEILENFSEKSLDYEYEALLERPIIVNILKLCNFDIELCSNVICVINKLLIFSRFDMRIFKLLKTIKKHLI